MSTAAATPQLTLDFVLSVLCAERERTPSMRLHLDFMMGALVRDPGRLAEMGPILQAIAVRNGVMDGSVKPQDGLKQFREMVTDDAEKVRIDRVLACKEVLDENTDWSVETHAALTEILAREFDGDVG